MLRLRLFLRFHPPPQKTVLLQFLWRAEQTEYIVYRSQYADVLQLLSLLQIPWDINMNTPFWNPFTVWLV